MKYSCLRSSIQESSRFVDDCRPHWRKNTPAHTNAAPSTVSVPETRPVTVTCATNRRGSEKADPAAAVSQGHALRGSPAVTSRTSSSGRDPDIEAHCAGIAYCDTSGELPKGLAFGNAFGHNLPNTAGENSKRRVPAASSGQPGIGCRSTQSPLSDAVPGSMGSGAKAFAEAGRSGLQPCPFIEAECAITS